MNNRLMVRCALVILLGAELLRAGEPWKEKPYTEWTLLDIKQISQDSPWGQLVWVIGSGGREPGIARETVDSTKPMAGGEESYRPGVQSEFLIQWESSLTMRQVLVRRRQLAGNIKEEEAAQFLSLKPSQYVLVVFGPDMRGFQGVGEEAMKASAYLEFKQSKQKLFPETVRYIRAGERLVEVHFYFPRQAGDKPLPTSQDKKVKFFFRTAADSISTDFDLRKMVREGAPDL